MAVQSRRVQQTHHRGSTLPGAQTASEQPILSAKRNWPDLIFYLIVM
jgi:hypothetical protein